MRRDADHVRDVDAWDLAVEIVALARETRCPVVLFLLPGGVVRVTLEGAESRDDLDGASLSLVGVYTRAARVEDVHDDILAMPRGWDDAP